MDNTSSVYAPPGLLKVGSKVFARYKTGAYCPDLLLSFVRLVTKGYGVDAKDPLATTNIF